MPVLLLVYNQRVQMKHFRVRSSSGAYEAVCGRAALDHLSAAVRAQRDVSAVFLLSSPRVWKNCGARVRNALRGVRTESPILFGDSERAKSLRTVEAVCRKLHRAGADRRSVLVAVGGGVAGDIAGFVAASYLRGVRLIHVPTTLVAQVDSAIGGKTGVNLPEGKNLAGAFYPPVAVVADPGLLRSLPDAQFRSGLYEVVKYGVIADARLFAFLEANMAKVLARDAAALATITARCVKIKARVVSKDERESGLRQILNFGHTFGHALETSGKYRRYLHGEAVGWGMIVATLLAFATNRISEKQTERILRLVTSVGPLPAIRGVGAKKLLALMRGDKKSHAGRIRWVLPRGIGRVEWGVELPEPLVAEAIAEAPEAVEIARARP